METIWSWETEPNFRKFLHKGVRCVVVRHPTLMSLCGYVRVPRGPLWDVLRRAVRIRPEADKSFFKNKRASRRADASSRGANHFLLREVQVHGGLTFAGFNPYFRGGRAMRGLWVGFDCAHAGDLIPQLLLLPFLEKVQHLYQRDTYRDMPFVEDNCRSLADQLAEINNLMR